MLKAKIFMSDLHIGDGGGADDFSPEKETKFCSLIDELAEKYAKGTELILLGDIFDLIEQKVGVDLAIRASVKAHSKTIKALKGWLSKGNKIFYITGNHDHAVRYPRISSFLARTLIADNDIFWGNFVIDDWYASKKMGLYAEHGNRFDVDNNHAGDEKCFGDRVVKEFLRPLESGDNDRYFTGEEWQAPLGLNISNPFKLLDNARPRGNIILLVEKLIKAGYLSQNTKNDLKKHILDLYKKNPNISKIKEFLINNLRWLIGDGQIQKALDDHYLPYRKNARAMMDKSRDDNILMLRDLSFKPRFIVMGHTHFFDQCRISPKCDYINLASWLDTVYINNSGDIADVMKNCPFLVFTKDGDGKVEQKMFDSTLDTPLDWAELKRERIKFGIPTTDNPAEEAGY